MLQSPGLQGKGEVSNFHQLPSPQSREEHRCLVVIVTGIGAETAETTPSVDEACVGRNGLNAAQAEMHVVRLYASVSSTLARMLRIPRTVRPISSGTEYGLC